ncbi:hypothetical protein [Arthrobacter sp. AQ5-05]|uniref:hypothetical protein n=1 Tax=Arthrobacter sp. AQ5-05 TaxID=2184581 RepID=UPI0012B54430|nr:hypothetical protein [Arthrobacter sp. AQ5-05]
MPVIQCSTAALTNCCDASVWGDHAAEKRGKKTLRIAIMPVATLGLATVLLAGNVVGLAGWRAGATAEAAEVLSTNLWLSMTSAHNPPDEEWVWERSGRIPTIFFSEGGKKVALARVQDAGHTSEVVRGNGGSFYNSPSSFPSEKELASYPKEPRKLLNCIYVKTSGQDQSMDGQTGIAIGRVEDLSHMRQDSSWLDHHSHLGGCFGALASIDAV